jgi:phenylalanyl-tRNA synthetase beta chain
MWLSLNIISKMVDLSGITPEDLALKLTMSTAEIDSIEKMNDNYKTIVAARILDVTPHPNADKLTVVSADTGSEKLQVVCGAPNHKKGDIAALALIGTKFTEEFTVKPAKLRGVESSGMFCSEKELGISDDHSGILILPPDTKPGTPLSEIFADRADVRLEIDNKSITHRPDLWSHVGFAREIGAILQRPVKDPVDSGLLNGLKPGSTLKIEIHNPEASPRYTGLLMKNIKIGPSPEWLQAAVTSIGMRPINNIVDITNYVMAEIGEPMHAFDRKKLKGDKIIVRLAAADEKLVTLDGQEHQLTAEDIVIADGSGPIALAGVMGGGNSEIDDSTTDIVLEAACFNPVYIRRTAQRFSLRTEAAVRFEKSLSPEITEQAILRCCQLIKEIIPSAEVPEGLLDAYPVKAEKLFVNTTYAFIKKRLGQQISDSRIADIIRSLHFGLTEKNGELNIEVPYYRATRDISIPEDIVEEVGRIYGYDNIDPVPPMVPSIPPARNEFRLFERAVKNFLSLEEAMSELSGYSFTGSAILDAAGINDDKELRLKNPLSVEHDRLRRTLVPNLLRNAASNQRYHDEFAVYELGRVYLKNDRKSSGLAVENTRVTGIFFSKENSSPLFYAAKSAALRLIKKLGVAAVETAAAGKGLRPYMHPARTIEITAGGKKAGYVFQLHPAIKENFEITGEAALFDIDLDILFAAEKSEHRFSELQRYPEVPFELSLLAGKTVYASEILKTAVKAGGTLVRSVDVVSVYEGQPVPEDKKSVSIRIVLAAPDRTLAGDEIDRVQKKVIGDLAAGGFPLR